MQGSIIQTLRKFVNSISENPTAWIEVKRKAGLEDKTYLPVQEYPDEEAFKLIKVAVKQFRIPREKFLEAFGEFLVPNLVKVYGFIMQPEWKTLDLLKNAAKYAHQIVEMQEGKAFSFKIEIKELSEQSLEVKYVSKKKLHGLGVGIIKGIANHYGENFEIERMESSQETNEQVLRVTRIS